VKRRAAVLIALLVAWASYGFVVLTMADREAGRCHQFGDLMMECIAPFELFFGGLSVLFVGATLALAFFALRSPSSPDRN
jgi:hypothetical protein